MGYDVKRLKEMIKRHEGYSSKPYRCPAGKLTIGYGRNLDDVGIYADEAELMLENDLRRAVQHLMRIFPDFISYPPRKQEALIDLMYNIGVGSFLTFKKMIAAIKNGDWIRAGEELENSKYCKQVPERCREIKHIIQHEDF